MYWKIRYSDNQSRVRSPLDKCKMFYQLLKMVNQKYPEILITNLC